MLGKVDKVTEPANPAVEKSTGADVNVDLQKSTINQGAVDATSKETPPVDDWKAKYDEARLKSEQDVGRVKSALQKQIDGIKLSSEEKERVYRQQLQDLQKSSMNDEERKVYEQSLDKEKLQELQGELNKVKAENAQTQQFFYYKDMFVNRFGLLPIDFAVDGTFEEMFNSGMIALETKIKQVQSVPQKKVGKEPPEVAPSSSAPATSALTLQELADKHTGGDVGMLFDRFEKRTLNPQLLNDIVAKQNK